MSIVTNIPPNEDLWEVWEWNDWENNEALIQEGGEDILFEQLSLVVEKEIKRIHSEIGEDTIAYENFDHGDADPTSRNVIYNLPSHENVPNTFKLMRMCNGPLKFGLTAWRKGTNPAYEDDKDLY